MEWYFEVWLTISVSVLITYFFVLPLGYLYYFIKSFFVENVKPTFFDRYNNNSQMTFVVFGVIFFPVILPFMAISLIIFSLIIFRDKVRRRNGFMTLD